LPAGAVSNLVVIIIGAAHLFLLAIVWFVIKSRVAGHKGEKDEHFEEENEQWGEGDENVVY